MFESEEQAQLLLDQINSLNGLEQVMLWRALGEQLLAAGNSFEKMIKGSPKLEMAVYSLMVEALRTPSPRE